MFRRIQVYWKVTVDKSVSNMTVEKVFLISKTAHAKEHELETCNLIISCRFLYCSFKQCKLDTSVLKIKGRKNVNTS
jgi:hypothetical protein